MTKADFIQLMADFPDDTPVLDGKGFDFKAYHIRATTYDDWEHSTKETIDGDVYETPAIGRAIAIGPRY